MNTGFLSEDWGVAQILKLENEWEEAKFIPEFEVDDRSVHYQELYNQGFRNPDFLLQYMLLRAKQNLQFNMVEFHENHKYLLDPYEAYLNIAKLFQKNNADSSLKYYTKAGLIVPNRFEPDFGKLMIYSQLKDTTNLLLTAKTIMDKPIKIPSPRVDFIKNAARNVVEDRKR